MISEERVPLISGCSSSIPRVIKKQKKYFLLCTDEFVKWPWVIGHYRRGTWLKNITREGLFTEEKG